LSSSILNDEDDKPAIGGIPLSLRDRFGDAAYDLIQPKKAAAQTPVVWFTSAGSR
jgi:hypothetical protein